MRSPKRLLCAASIVLVFAVAVPASRGDARPNPYLTIVDRNPFGIKPPPPPPPVETSTPVAPLAKVLLTGVINIMGPPRALFEITEQEAGKGPTVNKRILREGEKDGSIEVISIDVVHNSVRIRNGTIETNVVFEVAKQGSSGPGVPGGMPPPSATPPALPTPTVSSAGASPMIFSRQGSDTPGRSGSGVSVVGAPSASASAPAAFAGGLVPSGGPGGPYGASYAANTANNRFGNLGNNPGISTYGATDPNKPITRPLRTESQPAADPHTAAMNTYIGVETLRQHGIPVPETPLTKHLQQP